MKELEEIIICACENVEHQVIIRTVEGWEEVAVAIHLKHLPFHKRLWHGIKYIFGHKSKYGDFDEIIIAPKDVDKIKKVVEWLETDH